MMEGIRVPFEAAQSEFVEKRSRFIGHLWPVSSEEEAQEHIRAVKKQYHDARHNCWCYLLGDNILRYSDDGEPQGTAGQPMLNVFQREGVTDVCCVVTRYFGGILLGAGGLTRAYSKSARDTLAVAGVAEVGVWAQVRFACDYGLSERIKPELAAMEIIVETVDYGADITMTASVPFAHVAALQDRLTELSAGKIKVERLGQVSRPGSRMDIG